MIGVVRAEKVAGAGQRRQRKGRQDEEQDQLAVERPEAVAPVAVPAGVEPAAADDPTVAVEGARAPIDPLLRSPRND